MLLLPLYITDDNNKTYFGLHVKCPVSLSDFNPIWSSSTHFYRCPQYHISRKSGRWEPR